MHYEYLQKYGSPVRISTNELVFSDMQSWADIYGQSSNPCLKDPAVYNMFSVTGAVNVANAVDRGQHSRLRRLLANGFAERELLISEPHIAAKVNHFIETTFLRNAAGQPIEVYHRIHELYLDIVSELSFGKSFDTLKGENPTAFDDVKAFLTVVPAVSFFHFLRYLPIPAIREGLRGLKRLESFSQSCVSRFQNDLRNKNILERPSGFLKNLCLAKDPETGSSLAFDELVENAIIFIVAGSGTTSITTTYLLWHVLKNPVIHKKLVAEIRSNFSDPTMVPTYEEVSKLPYLEATIDETLRLHAPLSANPRISPGKLIAGRYVPKGTVLSTNSYVTARDHVIFPNPEQFEPERWFNASPEMRNMSRPFSYGPRNCIGLHLAEIGIYLTVSRMFQLMDLKLDSRTTEEMMLPCDKGSIEPVAGKLYVEILGHR